MHLSCQERPTRGTVFALNCAALPRISPKRIDGYAAGCLYRRPARQQTRLA